MTRIESGLRIAKASAAAVTAAFALAGATVAATAPAIDVPTQSFDQGPAGAKPVVKWRPDASSWVGERSDGKSFGVNVPLGAGGRLPLTVHLLSSEAQCHDEDITSADREQDKAFIRDGADRSDGLARADR